jgi:molecular chaperone DnaK (HSP70)
MTEQHHSSPARWISLALIAPASFGLFAATTVWASSVNPLTSSAPVSDAQTTAEASVTLREQAALDKQAEIDAMTADLEKIQARITKLKKATHKNNVAAAAPIPRVHVSTSKRPTTHTTTGASGG